MSYDELDRAIVALRQHRGGASTNADRTEAEVMARVRKQQRSRVRWRWMVPIAAICAASSAWAASHPELARVVRAILSGDSDSTTSSTASRLRSPSSQPAIVINSETASANDAGAPLSSATPLVEAGAPLSSATLLVEAGAPLSSATLLVDPSAMTVPTPGLSSRSSVQSHRTASSATSVPVLKNTAPRPAYELFRDAQQLQFGGKDPAAAIGIWDQYLTVDPNGALALEARFNRGLCLVALGRSREAERALTPFASGEYGEYRRQEARSILERLGAKTQGSVELSTPAGDR